MTNLKNYFSYELPKKFDAETSEFFLPPKLNEITVANDLQIKALQMHILGYEELYNYLISLEEVEHDKLLNFKGFQLDTHLTHSLEYECPSAYTILMAKSIQNINESSLNFTPFQIESCFKIIDHSIKSFGALGHYFGLRFNLQLAHYYYSNFKKEEKSFKFNFSHGYINNSTSKEYYEKCFSHFNIFSSLIEAESDKNIFHNAYMGRKIDDVFFNEVGCERKTFAEYLLPYYSSLSLEIKLP